MTRTKKSAALLKILVIAAILILLPIVTPNMYIMQIINMIGIYIILGIGINVLTGYTGQLSLGQAAFFGIGAYTAALMNTRAGLQFIPCLLGSVVVTAFFGVVLAIPALKVKGSYLALLTMGFGEVVRIVMINWTPVTNGTAGVLGIQSPVIFGFSFDTLKKYYFLILLFVLLGLAYESIIIRTRTGRAFIAIREDNEAAELTGIDVTAYKIKAFVLSAVYCGVAGCLYAMMIKYVSPDTFVSNTSSVILWTAIVGGFGTVIGPVLGGIIMQVLPEALRFLGDWRLVVYGVILLVVILRFPGGLTAVDGVNLKVEENQICALIGPNGAGKTTVFNMITGAYQVTSGDVVFNSESICGKKPHQIVEKGIARTFQNIRLFKSATVLENVMTGFHCKTKTGMFNVIFNYRKCMQEEAECREKALEILRFLGLEDVKNLEARNIPYGHQRLLEIGRALATSPKLLLLDEPAAGMNSQEKKELVNTIRKIRDTYHLAVLLVEHDMELVMGISENITVINFGRPIACGTAEEIQSNNDVIEAYLGRSDDE